MAYNKALVKMKVKSRLNGIFVEIIDDIPNSEIFHRNNELTVHM